MMRPQNWRSIIRTSVNASGGATVTTSGSQVATITVQPATIPMSLTSRRVRPLVVSEDGGGVEVMVTREFGDLGVQLAVAGGDYTANHLAVSSLEEADLTKSFSSAQSAVTVFLNWMRYHFIAIIFVELDLTLWRMLTALLLPTSASGNGSLAFVVIAENDDARGVLQLSSSTYEAEESSQNFVTVSRGAGSFGTVTVDWEAVAITAQSSDFTPQSGSVVLADGVSSTQLPLSIVDDTEPEFSETLTVSLVGSGRGARLDGILSATVTILTSDDPNGALQFAVGSRSVSVLEPEDGASVSVSLVVERTGGATGVVEVSWTLTSQTGMILRWTLCQCSGTLPVHQWSYPAVYHSYNHPDIIPELLREEVIIEEGSSSVNIPVTILADELPELDETFQLSLVSVYFTEEVPEDMGDGGPQLGEITVSEIVIRENDDPYGRFRIAGGSGESVVRVPEADSLGVSLTVTREAGRVGTVEVTWSVSGTAEENVDFAGAVLASDGGSEATVVIEANDNAAGIVGLVDSARSVIVDEGGTVSLGLERSLGNLGVVEVTWEISGPGNVSLEFVPHQGPQPSKSVCHFPSPLPLSLHFLSRRSPSRCSYGPLVLLDVAYEAVMGNVRTLAGNSTLATPGLDFNNSNRTIRLEDGQLSATVLVPIINETEPELSEMFLVRLSSVTLDPQ
ncbi:Adhesion G-protein coupled receptor V1 [Geodia barretti]|uniref:Adhesion G-protein coupled receptor V1 n=1 Tax=Geodia barretti TaxID=519541 RepID=A0AA35SJD0_GEOBA|nr:Adhesion G-protein coupled receptor V1 [Geodia barretti]